MSDSVMNKAVRLFKGLLMFLLKLIYIGSFFLVSILLLKMLYFSQTSFSAWNEPEIESFFAEYIQNEDSIKGFEKLGEKMSRGHFHITDESMDRQETDPPLCLRCHGIYPHIKKEKTISYLNLHTGFTACEVCHVRKGPEDKGHAFRWVDFETGKISMRAKGRYGNYNAKIIPVMITAGKQVRVDKLINDKFLNLYLKLKGRKYTLKQQQDKTKKMHERNLTKKPISCLECHKRKGYLNFAKLGYSKNRIDQLVSSEVSGMVEHYDTFYMPKMLMMR